MQREVKFRSETRILFSAILLFTGSLGQIVPQECDLSFHLTVTNTNNTVKFVGISTSETGDVGGNGTVGSRLTCSCSATGLSPAKWLGPLGSPVSNGSFEPTAGIHYMLVDHPGTAVQLYTNNNVFSCSEAGNYTCVIGENRREVLVLPVGVECGLTNVTIVANPDEPLASGDAVTLQCSVVDPTESDLSFQWFKDDRLIPGQSSSTLVLDAVGQNDTGTYTCQVSNRLGMKKQTFDLLLKSQGPDELTAAPISADGLTLEILTPMVCFNRPVQLLCNHPLLLASRNFSTSRPSWMEDYTIVALDGGMYRSASHINEKQVILELVPERSHFEPLGAHNYTCFFHLLGGGTLESNPVLVRPQDKPLQPRMLHSTPGIWDARIQWVNDDNQCFDSQDTCRLAYNITWFATSGGPMHSDATAHPKSEFTLTGLRPGTEYTATVKAQCQADKLSSQESVVSLRTEDSRNAALVLDTFNATTCFGRPLFLHCHHPDTTSHVEDIPVFDSMLVHWKRDGAVIAVDGSTYHIAHHSKILTVLVVTYHREDFRETTNNFSCFIPFENGTSLQSNEVQVHLNVSYARLYNFSTFGETLDWSHIVACSALITPTTNFNVTVFLSSPEGIVGYTRITSLTSLNIAEEANVSFPRDQRIAVSLQILEEEADTVYFTVTSSQEYACLGEIYKMNCTSTAPFNDCDISYPCWFKDNKAFPTACDSGRCKSYNSQTRELSVYVPRNDSTAHVYACGALVKPKPGCPHSNKFTVKPLRRPLSPVLENYTSTETTLWLKWAHNKVCFRDCIVYNISWQRSSSDTVEKSMVVNGTNYTIRDLMPGQTYSVQICAVCEGYSPNCTEPEEYRTTVPDPAAVVADSVMGVIETVIIIAGIFAVIICIVIWYYRRKNEGKERVGPTNNGDSGKESNIKG